MDIFKTQTGKKMELSKDEYPLIIEADTNDGKQTYITEKKWNGKLMTTKETPKYLLTNTSN